jgi:hypothetical protein
VGTWDELISRLAVSVEEVIEGRFLTLDYVTGGLPIPYAQLAHTGGQRLCEVVSARHLPAGEWPLNELALQRTGWSVPCGDDLPNWWRYDLTEPDEIAGGLLRGLRDGRGCTDPGAFRWHIGSFPPGPGDGEEIPECNVVALAA